MKFVYWTATWLAGITAVLWAMAAGQWLGAVILIPAWLGLAVVVGRRFTG